MAERVYGRADYNAERARILAGSPSCSYCPNPATSADHQPPLSVHFHRERSQCCILVPSCLPCARRQGGLLAARQSGWRAAAAMPIADDPLGFDVSSPVWDVAWLDGLRVVPEDGWWPRLMSVPHPRAVGSWGAEVVKWAKKQRGITLHWWQQLVLARLLEHDADGLLVWRDVFLSVARQSGKSVLLSVLGDWRSEQSRRFGEPQLVMHTADTLRHALDVWGLALPRAQALGLTVRRSQGSEAILKPDHGMWVVRSQAAVVGSAVSLAMADEAQGIKLSTVTENLSPTLVEKVQAQLVLVSTAHSACTDLMPTYRLQGTADLDAPGRLLLLEWSADPSVRLGDPVAARQASPRWSLRREADIGDAVARALATPPGHELRVAVDVQWYNRWPSLASRGAGELLLEAEVWAGCSGSLEGLQPGWVAIEDNFGHGAAVAFVASDGDRFEVDGLMCESWDAALVWARKFLDESPSSKLLVGASMTRSVPADMPGGLIRAGGAEARRGLAVLRSLVSTGRVVHDRTTDLDGQIAGARVRPVADGLALVSVGRQDLLRAALWALWYAQQPPPVPAIR